MVKFFQLAPRPKIAKYESFNLRTKIHNSGIIKRGLKSKFDCPEIK